MKPKGIVYLVGAGPGDAGLLTLRGAELLDRADVVVCDARVNPELLRRAPKTAEIIHEGQPSTEPPGPPTALAELLIARARAGKTVVRLMGGDPYLFAGGGQEAEQLKDAGIPFEVVPGVSSVAAAPNYAGVPVTHRDFASQLTLIAPHRNPSPGAPGIDWAQVAKTPGTKVLQLDSDSDRPHRRRPPGPGPAARHPGCAGPLGRRWPATVGRRHARHDCRRRRQSEHRPAGSGQSSATS